MQLKEHVVYGGAASLALVPFYHERSAFFFLASVFIDLDHYMDFLYYARFRDWSAKRMFQFHGTLARWREREDFCALEAFHTAEFLLGLLAVAAFFHSTELFLVFFGMVFHLGLDLWRLAEWRRVDLRAISFVEYWILRRAMKKRGVRIEQIFEEAYGSVRADLKAKEGDGGQRKAVESNGDGLRAVVK